MRQNGSTLNKETMTLEEKLAILPGKTGVYLLKDAGGTILYVGKAKSLRSRVRSYFRGTHEHPRIAALVAKVADLVILSTDSEIEALILEAPRDGVILIGDIPWEGRKLQEGDNVWRGFVIMRLPDLSNMRVVARLSDVDDGRVRSGMKATVELDAHPEVSYDAVVEDVTPVAQESSRRSLRPLSTSRIPKPYETRNQITSRAAR